MGRFWRASPAPPPTDWLCSAASTASCRSITVTYAVRPSSWQKSGGWIAAFGDGILTIGSGGPLALAAARVLMRHTELDAEGIAREALSIASEIDIYTNDQITVEVLAGDAGDT